MITQGSHVFETGQNIHIQEAKDAEDAEVSLNQNSRKGISPILLDHILSFLFKSYWYFTFSFSFFYSQK